MKGHSEQHKFYPREVILEVTNHCNLRCRHCHFHGQGTLKRRPLGHMSPHLWRRLLDELATWPQPVTLLTHGAGEPLLYPHLDELLDRAARIPHVRLGFMTNGMLLDSQWTERILAFRVDFLALSIDGVVPETHDAVRRNASLERIERNVVHLIERKTNSGSTTPRLSFNMVLYPHILDQGEAFVDRWIPYAESITLATFRPIGSRHLWAPSQAPPFQPCRLLWEQCVIAWDGRVGLCCEDIHMDVQTGSAVERPLAELFQHSPVLARYRQAHEMGRHDTLLLCNTCHVWGADIKLEQRREIRGGLPVSVVSTPAYRLYVPERS